MNTQVLEADVAKTLVAECGPNLGNSLTEKPVFPDGRQDACAVRHSTVNGKNYGFDSIFLVWKVGPKIRWKRVVDSRKTTDYIYIDGVTVDGERVRVAYSGSNSGRTWKRSRSVRLH